MWNNLFALSKINYLTLINKKGFIVAILLLIIVGLFIIPRNNANYVTFYIGGYTGYPNSFWVGNLGAILSNFVISLIAFFFLEGAYAEEKHNGVGLLINGTACTNFQLLLFKWLSYIYLVFTLLGIIAITLFFINIKSAELVGFVKPFLIYSIPYLVLLSFFVLFLDYIVNSRGVKITVFLLVILFAFSPLAGKYFDFLGANNFVDHVKYYIIETREKNLTYGIGYIKSINITYKNVPELTWDMNILGYKLFLIGLATLILYLSTFVFKRYASTSTANHEISVKDLNEIPISIDFSKRDFRQAVFSPVGKSVRYLISAECAVFRSSFSRNWIAAFLLIYILSFTLGFKTASNFIVPLLFIISFPIFEN